MDDGWESSFRTLTFVSPCICSSSALIQIDEAVVQSHFTHKLSSHKQSGAKFQLQATPKHLVCGFALRNESRLEWIWRLRQKIDVNFNVAGKTQTNIRYNNNQIGTLILFHLSPTRTVYGTKLLHFSSLLYHLKN